MATAKRIQMKVGAKPEQIISPEGIFLGNFTEGLGYWVTDENKATVDLVINDGRAEYVDPASAPLPTQPGGLQVKAAPGQVGGSVTVAASKPPVKPTVKQQKATPTGGFQGGGKK